MSRRSQQAATPALKILVAAGVWHRLHTYEHDPNSRLFGEEAAQRLAISPAQIFKTLVVTTPQGTVANAVLAVADLLNLKLLAKALGVKQAVLAAEAQAMRKTGYVVGGISPLGQKNQLPTVVDTSVEQHETVLVSAGQRGASVELHVADLIALTTATVAPIRRTAS